MTRERLTLGLLLASIFLIRAIHLDQPIVENYVGRQIPTAMVARNLERGSGFLHPQLDTGPFPNQFLVEPPIYAQLVASFRPILGMNLEPTGRLVSASAVVLAAWGLFGLVRRREGLTVAFLALGSFGLFPVMIRYGRAFQPDALMVGCVVAGLRGWDEYEASGNWRWAVFGGFVLAIGLALKITVAWALLPFLLILTRWKIGWKLAMSAVMLLPAVAWYVYASQAVATPGSTASADNVGLWLKALSPENWLRFSTYDSIGRGLVIRSFTPIGFVLAYYGLLGCGKLDRLWVGWAVGCALSILGLASKWHHAYYWMVVAPLAAGGVARGLDHLANLGKYGRPLAIGLGSFFLVMCGVQSASTFRTPVEWTGLLEAARAVDSQTTAERMIVGAEALLYYADRPGYRLEINEQSAQRAASEWGCLVNDPNPLALIEVYRAIELSGKFKSQRTDLSQLPFIPKTPPTGSSWWWYAGYADRDLLIVDVGSVEHEPQRRKWRETVRERQKTRILRDEPGLMIFEVDSFEFPRPVY